MQITVDDQTFAIEDPGTRTVQDFADEVCGPPTKLDSRLVVGAACDGKDIASDQLNDFMLSPANRFESVVLDTSPVRDQLRLALEQALAMLQEAHASREQAADCLNEGSHEGAMASLQKVLEAFKQVQHTAVLAAQLLEIDLEEFDVNGQGFLDVINSVKTHLGELKAGMENQDFVAVSDLLRYEIGEPIDGWMALTGKLHERLG